MARQLQHLDIDFIPAGLKTKDDPLGRSSYLSWRARVGDDDVGTLQYGDVTQLPDGTSMLAEDVLSDFVAGMFAAIRKVLDVARIDPKEPA